MIDGLDLDGVDRWHLILSARIGQCIDDAVREARRRGFDRLEHNGRIWDVAGFTMEKWAERVERKGA